MKIILLILLSSCTLLIKADYPRHKLRGPPQSLRIPPSKQFSKKWHQQPHPPRGPLRSRPIPVHMPPSHKIPMGIPQVPPRSVALPVRTFWKNAHLSTGKIPQEKPYVPTKEKPFLAAPSIGSQELDYHIQTNSIPTTHTNPIKQVGEKGPIHTIPAPNLSLKDRPIVVDEVKYQLKTPQQIVEQNHQYQVTEPPEHLTKSKVYRQQQLIQQLPQLLYQQQFQQQPQQIQPSLQQLQQQQRQQQQLQQHILSQEQYLQGLPKKVEVQPQVYYTTDAISLPQTLTLPQKTPQGDIYLNNPELYKLIEATYPQQTQVQFQEIQQSFYQPQKQIPDYQALLSQQLFQPEQQNIEPTENTKRTTDNKHFEPEYQSFNYDEQAHQKSQKGLTKEQLSSLVTAAYRLDTKPSSIQSRNSVDPSAQAQLIQSYFDSRSDVEENDVEPDAQPSADKRTESDKIKEELLSSSYFSSLPSKEAADRLAHLQAAGKINSNLMKITSDDEINDSRKDEFEVDTQGSSNERSNEGYQKDEIIEYEDYSQEEENGSSEEKNVEFGDKLHRNS